MSPRRVVVVGSERVGKTSLIQALLSGSSISNLQVYAPTVMDEAHYVSPSLIVVDTAGSPSLDRLRPFAYNGATAFIIVFDTTNRLSLQDVVERWVPEISVFGAGLPFSIVAAKADMRVAAGPEGKIPEDIVTVEEGEEVALQVGASRYVETSALMNVGVSEAFVDPATTDEDLNEPELPAPSETAAAAAEATAGRPRARSGAVPSTASSSSAASTGARKPLKPASRSHIGTNTATTTSSVTTAKRRSTLSNASTVQMPPSSSSGHTRSARPPSSFSTNTPAAPLRRMSAAAVSHPSSHMAASTSRPPSRALSPNPSTPSSPSTNALVGSLKRRTPSTVRSPMTAPATPVAPRARDQHREVKVDPAVAARTGNGGVIPATTMVVRRAGSVTKKKASDATSTTASSSGPSSSGGAKKLLAATAKEKRHPATAESGTSETVKEEQPFWMRLSAASTASSRQKASS